MRISHEHRFVFLAYPRTGSTTIRGILAGYSDVESVHVTEISKTFPFYHHITARKLKQIFDREGWDWFAYRRFCVVRNPFDRVVSLYHHKMKTASATVRGRGVMYNFARRVRNTIRPIDRFSDYVRQLDPESGLTKSLHAFIGDGAGGVLVDDVLSFENLNTELPSYLGKMGIRINPGDIPHLNASERRAAYKEYYDEDSRVRVAQIYAQELKRFGYEF